MLKIIIFIVCYLMVFYKKALIKPFAKKSPSIIHKIELSTVNIYTTQNKDKIIIPKDLSEFFRFYLSDEKKKNFKNSLGSGFIIDEYLHIITNFHVVENASNINVTVGRNNKYKYQAKIIGKDKKTDLALLKIDSTNKLKFIKLGNSDKCEVGEKIIAIGNSYGFESTVTTGIISAKERMLGKYFYEEFIQTDASINKGNSGGPMINLKGEVIGINSAIISPNGGNIGIGFAIPSNTTKHIISKLFVYGKVYRPWLGIKFKQIYKKLLFIPSIKVNKVIKNSPAERAGLRSNDMIISYNNIKIKINTNFIKLISNSSIKNSIFIKLVRRNKILTYKVKLEIPKKKYEEETYKKIIFLGITVAKLNKDIIVTNISNTSMAKTNGIKIGDTILSINKYSINSLISLDKILNKIKSKRVTLLIVRNKEYFFTTIK